ncbi:bifunctional acetate--CoA ligase family protein/GNAT family N-acetyltransferase [Thermodesulfovibrionales bacterium]|nr:bifunctional acetate--CoA ligase family protein/GNAT family N-acetyltransferase [Thermodesulfovibrionales bacterium]
MSIKNLELFFNPGRIAVIGASEDRRSLGCAVFENLIGKGFKGVVYPVNTREGSVHGVETYHKITDIQRDIDLAILAVPCEEAIAHIEESGHKGVKGIIMLCPDFHYRVPDPHAFEAGIMAVACKYGIRLLGPSSLGFIRPGKQLNASAFPAMPPKGGIALISQSAAIPIALLDRAVSKNIGFSYFISVGGSFDIDIPDMIDFLGVDPETRAIIIYMESLKSGRKFMTSARSFARSKPIVVVKSGKFEELDYFTLTHTGILAGEDLVYDAAFKRAGVVRVDELIDLFYLAETLSKQRRPRGNRLAIISNAGGPAVIAVDTLLKSGGVLAQFSHETRDTLRDRLPSKMPIENPLDILSDASLEDYKIVVNSCLKDKGVDGVLVIHTSFFGAKSKEIAEVVASTSKEYPYKPLLTSWMGEEMVKPSRELLNDRGIPTFTAPEWAIKNFIYMHRYDVNLRLLLETPEAILKDFVPDKGRVEEVIKNASERQRLVLTFNEAKEILLAYGIPVVPTREARSEREAIHIAGEIGYPVVLKIDSHKVFHKLKKGGIVLNIKDQEGVVDAFKRMTEIALSFGDTETRVLVQPMIAERGYELVIGAKKDLTFGSVIIFGTGGELLEVLKDYSVGLPPLNQALARRIIAETRIFQHLSTHPLFEDMLRHLEEILVRFTQMIIDFPQIKEVDINPFLVIGKSGVALDVGILLEDGILGGFERHKSELCPTHLSICPYPVRLVTNITLRDGRPATIRPIRPEDSPLVEEFFSASSEQTIALRFFQRFTDLADEQLARYCQVDYDRELALVCVIVEDGRERIIGDVRFMKQPNMEDAEMAVIVGDSWHGQGIGRGICEYCLEVARRAGIKKMWMDILKVNTCMLNLADRMGFRQVYVDEDSIKVALEL